MISSMTYADVTIQSYLELRLHANSTLRAPGAERLSSSGNRGGQQPNQDRESDSAPRTFQTGGDVVEPGKLHQGLVHPTKTAVILKKFCDVDLGDENEPDKSQYKGAGDPANAGGGPSDEANKKVARRV